MAEYKSDLLIIGSGPAGYTAGIYAVRAGVNTLIVTGANKGGQLIRTGLVENFPGFVEPLSGFELMDNMYKQAVNLGVKLIDDEISEVDFYDRPFVCSSAGGNSFIAKAIIIATGASVKWLGLPGEQKFMGYGVSSCATCDGFFYRGKEVAVIGGGNSALEQALHLTGYVEKVYIIHRRHYFNAEQIMQQRVFDNRKISIFWNNVVDEISGTDNPKEVTGIQIRDVKSDKKKYLDVSGVFVSIGHHPNTEMFRKYLQLDSGGYIITGPHSCATEIAGVFAAGDVCSPYRQAIIAAGNGAKAALEAIRYL